MDVLQFLIWLLMQLFKRITSYFSLPESLHDTSDLMPAKETCEQSLEENQMETSLASAVNVNSTPEKDELKEFEINKTPSFMDDGDKAYIVLLNVFKYLSFRDILTVARVSKVWNVVALDDSLWKTVKIKYDLNVTDCYSFGKSLEKHGTQTLDIGEIGIIRSELCIALSTVKTLKKIVIGYCPSDGLATLAKNANQLTSLTVFIIDREFHLEHLLNLKNLTKLKLGGNSCRLSFGEMNKNSDVTTRTSCFKHMKKLTSLSLTGMTHLYKVIDIPSTVTSLSLGECCKDTCKFLVGVLPKLVNLQSLCLEEFYTHFYVVDMLKVVSSLPRLNKLQLLYIGLMEDAFEKALAMCTNLKTLVIYTSPQGYSPMANGVVYTAVSKLKHSLKNFVWGFYTESFNDTIYNLENWDPHSYIFFQSLSDLEEQFKRLLPHTNTKIIELPLKNNDEC